MDRQIVEMVSDGPLSGCLTVEKVIENRKTLGIPME